jgi:formyltetrahydrofolate hydrolase
VVLARYMQILTPKFVGAYPNTTIKLDPHRAEVERRVLSRAVQRHIEDRILVDGARTVVFS